MPKDIRTLTEAEREWLAILIEECSEVAAVATKVLRFGWRPHDDVANKDYDNQVLLERELGDLKVAVTIGTQSGNISPTRIDEAAARKKFTINQYLNHNRVY